MRKTSRTPIANNFAVCPKSNGYTDPWLILTDLNSIDADISWYRFRCWIECSYRDVKSDGFGWHKTRLRQPDRAERHWLAMAVAMLWMITLGDDCQTTSNQPVISQEQKFHKPNSTRQLSCFLNGLLTVVARLLTGQSVTLGCLLPNSLNPFSDFTFSNSS